MPDIALTADEVNILLLALSKLSPELLSNAGYSHKQAESLYNELASQKSFWDEVRYADCIRQEPPVDPYGLPEGPGFEEDLTRKT